jgi:hypothetical protein
MQRFNRLWLAGFFVAALLALGPSIASAHESRDVADGQYTFVVGFLDEPAFTTVKNGLDLRVTAAPEGTPAEGEEAEGVPVEGLEATLKAEVIYGDQRRDLTLEPAFRDPGAYESWFFPMAAGDYSFHIYGDINGTPIDETFTSSPEGFSAVEDRALYEFPSAAGSTTDGGAIGSVTSGGNAGVGTLIGGIVLAAIAGAAGLAAVQRALGGRRIVRQRPATAPVNNRL